MALLQFRSPVSYEDHETAFEDFLRTFKAAPTSVLENALDGMTIDEDDFSDDYDFVDDDDNEAQNRRRAARKSARQPRLKYVDLLQRIANRQEEEITISLDDLAKYDEMLIENGQPMRLVASIEANAKHYLDIMARAVDKVMPEPTREINYKDDILDVLMTQRHARNSAVTRAAEQQTEAVEPQLFPAELTRRYTLNFKPQLDGPSSTKALAVRHVRGEHLGHLITVRGIATRVSDVKPTVEVNAYSCDECGCEVFQPVGSKTFGPLEECPSADCKTNNIRGRLHHSARSSKFQPFQEVKIQELAEQVPVGHIPRMLTILSHGALVRRINPGDVVDVAGIFLPTPYTGFKAIKAGLLTDTYLEAQHVIQHKESYDDQTVDKDSLARLEKHRRSGQIYKYLAKSIAPEIYGHIDVKKALLLLLVGGARKDMGDGMKIRGDINICLMGDPGVAKSQLLKYITKVAPRGVYTTGRGSSGVGLTAAVMKDPVTDEMILEGGALVLADNGICCIDEFDKMDDNDRTAIHEVMEQQTISISKAGISTTLNARTSILAAANPLYGRYNPRLSPVENINLPAALLSRFDVLFLILDTATRDNDALLARHVTHVHMYNKHPNADGVIFSPHEVRQYVAHARTFNPTIPEDVSEYMVKAYVRMRDEQVKEEKNKKQFAHTTPRTLLALIRLSQSLARLRFADTVVQEDVDEALRLVEVSKLSLYDESSHRKDLAPSSRIYKLVEALALGDQCRPDDADEDDEDSLGVELSMKKVETRVIAKGFTKDQWLSALEEYSEMDIWQTTGNGSRLIFIGHDAGKPVDGMDEYDGAEY